MNQVLTSVLGLPRVGEKRELKKAVEAYWKGKSSQDELQKTAKELRAKNWKLQKDSGIDLITSNDFSFYDQVLDLAATLGAVPERYNWDGKEVSLDTYFAMARGNDKITACEMTKWFDTNYHYIVPELNSKTQFKLSSEKIFNEYNEAKEQGIETKPVLLGPVSFLYLSKSVDENESWDRFSLIDQLTETYTEILKKLDEQGVQWIQIDEPVLSFDLDDKVKALYKNAFDKLRAATKAKIIVTNYFGELRDNLDTFFSLSADAFHVDLVRGEKEWQQAIDKTPAGKILSLGVVNGRNIWKNNYEKSLEIINAAKDKLGAERVMVSSSCSLLHSPYTLRFEEKLDADLKNWLAFAEEKLVEIKDLANAANGNADQAKLDANKQAVESRKTSSKIHNKAVKERMAALKDADFKRKTEFNGRIKEQNSNLNLPKFPTTTIGSFPQTTEIRKARAALKKGEMSETDYDKFIEEKTIEVIKFQEEVDIDMLVHGEYERNDMVEYFGEQLSGFAFTQFGWVQSYGSRCVKPPVIFGDVSRENPMTVRWTKFAQDNTKRPMKGMLTGPVTILMWSFERDDQSLQDTAYQIGLALRDEVTDLETAGIKAIQMDEPAFREGLPLRKADWEEYFGWAVNAFRLSSSSVENKTQIHTHMCYSEFNDIIDKIADLDADVISIETSRSKMELLESFETFNYPNQIGPGVYDIHSPRVPGEEEMAQLLERANKVLPVENLWVNPDCGLKTRDWSEVKPSLDNMVKAAKKLRSLVAA